jgi:hypothetical protein
MYLFFRYYLIFVFIFWAILEVIVESLKNRKINLIIDFICNFVTSVLISINYVMNILLCIPANRLLITPQGDKFGNSKKNFTQTLRINIVKGTTKPRGIILYKVLQSITNFGKHE